MLLVTASDGEEVKLAAGGKTKLTLMLIDGLVPQLLEALTLIVPDEVPKVTVILSVPCPEVMVAPLGTVQL